MELVQQRVSQKGDSTYSVLSLEGKQLCFTIEDIHHNVKVDNETRISSGRYEIKFREVLSPKTKRYRELYPSWFTWHLELQDVPEFTYIYMHIGNRSSDSSGCLLLNKGVSELSNGNYVGHSSWAAFIEVYSIISDALTSGERVFITIRDEIYVY